MSNEIETREELVERVRRERMVKYIDPEYVENRVADVGNPPMPATDLNIAAVIANILANLPWYDEYTAALIAMDSIRYYDKPENAHMPAEMLEWYRDKAKESIDES